MNRSESTKEIAKALAEAQGKIGAAKKDKVNPHFKQSYADLASVVDAIREPLSQAGIAWIQPMTPTGKQEVCIETVLLHTSGEWLSSTTTIPVNTANAQGFGSALTYARRYGLASLVGVAPDDDDGNAASRSPPREDTVDAEHEVSKEEDRPQRGSAKGAPPNGVHINEGNAAVQAIIQAAKARWKPFVDKIETPGAASACIGEIKADDPPLGTESLLAVKQMLVAKCKELGYVYDTASKAYILPVAVEEEEPAY